MAELRAAHMVSRRDAHNCQPNGLDHGFEYASKLNASYDLGKLAKVFEIVAHKEKDWKNFAYLQHFLVRFVDAADLFQPMT